MERTSDSAQDPSRPPDNGPADTQESPCNNEKICRICFESEDESRGRLFRPCRCSGTMAFVHVLCLNEWRQVSTNSNSFFQCDFCKYKYSIVRTRWASVMSSPAALSLTTLALFFLLTFLSGYVSKFILFHCLDLGNGSPNSDGAESNPFVEHEYHWFFKDLEFMVTDGNYGASVTTIDSFHFLSGLVFIGILGGFNILVSLAANIVHDNFRVHRHLGRLGRVQNGFAWRAGDAVSMLGILGMITLGLLNTMSFIYKMVKKGSKKVLQYLEGAILDVTEAENGHTGLQRDICAKRNERRASLGLPLDKSATPVTTLPGSFGPPRPQAPPPVVPPAKSLPHDASLGCSISGTCQAGVPGGASHTIQVETADSTKVEPGPPPS